MDSTLINILTRRNVDSGTRRRVNHDSLRLAKLFFSALAMFSFLLSIELFFVASNELRAFAAFAWSTLYIAAIIGLDERRRWGYFLTLAILLVQPTALAAFTQPFWQLGAIIGVAAFPLALYLSQNKISNLFD